MRYFLFLATLIISFCACSTSKTVQTIDYSNYPKTLQTAFAKHGGLEQWQAMQAMSYTLVDPDGSEQHWVDLHNRRDKIIGPNFKMGFDGSDIWIDAKPDYVGNPVFIHNLMFYFYAMPFLLTDDGIIYSKTDDLVFDGKAYPGVGIAYKDGVGASSKDEYFIHIDPTTGNMEWLGYTVTYFSKKKSSKVKWIRYDDWTETKKLLLPNSITWYNLEEGQPTTPRNTIQFKDLNLSKKPFGAAVFEKTVGARVVE